MSAAEKFLVDFHAKYPSCTSSAMASGWVTARDAAHGSPTQPKSSSYDLLARAVPADAKQLLDLACGDGFLITKILSKGRSVVGVDLSAGELAVARRTFDGNPAVSFHEGRAQELPLPSGSIDAAVSHMAVMLMAPIEPVVQELARVLKPGGQFAMLVPSEHQEGLWVSFVKIARGILHDEAGAMAIGDPRMRTPAGIAEVFNSANGFKAVEIEDFVLHCDGTAASVKKYLETTYFVGLISAAGLERLWKETDALLAKSSGPDGIITHPLGVRLVKCVRS